MWKRAALTVLLLIFSAPLLIGQLAASDRSVTVTATRTPSVPPDLGMFEVAVLSPTDASRDDVLAVIQGSGISVANFSSVYTTTTTQFSNAGRTSQDFLSWSFTLTAPLSNLKTTVAQLSGLQQTVAKNNNGMSVSYSLRGTQISPQALAGQSCAAADLAADARTQAQKMASAAGLAVGAVLAVSGSSTATPAGPTLFANATYQPSCSLTVKFSLVGF
jgi:uncharacterized protein YggE